MLLVRHVGGIECRDRKRGNEEEKSADGEAEFEQKKR